MQAVKKVNFKSIVSVGYAPTLAMPPEQKRPFELPFRLENVVFLRESKGKVQETRRSR